MKPEDFKLEHVNKILEIYNSCVGPVDLEILSSQRVLDDIKERLVYMFGKNS